MATHPKSIQQLIQSGDHHLARQRLRTLLKYHPDDARAWYALALTLDDRSEQVKSLRRSLKADPQFKPARQRLAKLQVARPSGRPIVSAWLLITGLFVLLGLGAALGLQVLDQQKPEPASAAIAALPTVDESVLEPAAQISTPLLVEVVGTEPEPDALPTMENDSFVLESDAMAVALESFEEAEPGEVESPFELPSALMLPVEIIDETDSDIEVFVADMGPVEVTSYTDSVWSVSEPIVIPTLASPPADDTADVATTGESAASGARGPDDKTDSEVISALQTGETTRVIIYFSGPSIMSPSVGVPDVQVQANIASQRAAIIADLPIDHVRISREYDFFPGMAAVITKSGLSALEDDPRVEYIQLDQSVQAHLAQSRQLINVPAVESMGYTGQGVNVAVLDTGIQANHPNLSNNVVAQRCYLQTGCPGGGTVGNNAADGHGHGTHVSGIITSNNATHRGVADGAGIVAVKVLDNRGGGWDSDILAGLDWVYANRHTQNIRVVNMSLGSNTTYTSVCDSQQPGYRNAINNLVNGGVAVFAASGNDGWTTRMSAPACVSNAISVGSVCDETGTRWRSYGIVTCTRDRVSSFSNAASFLDILAPGAFVTAPWIGSGSREIEGTSMASPMAAGVAALMLQANPSLTPAQIRNTLRTTGVSVVDNRGSVSRTFPRVNAQAAINAVAAPRLISPANGIVTSNPRPTFRWTTVSGATVYQLHVTSASTWTGGATVNITGTQWTWSNNLSNLTYRWRVRAFRHGAWSDWSIGRVFTVDTTPQPPTLISPANAITTSNLRPTFNWTSVPSASVYQLHVTSANTWTGGATVNVTGTQWTWSNNLSNLTYRWRVRAFANGQWSAWSTGRVFTVDSTPQPPTLIAPANAITTSNLRPTFQWSVVPGATQYQLHVTSASTWTGGATVNVTGTQWTWSNNLSNLTYRWRVRAFANGQWSGWSTGRLFTVDTAPPGPALIAPTNAVTTFNPRPTFSWTSLPGATQYQIHVTSASTWTGGATLNVTGTQWTWSNNLSNLTYRWRVRGLVNGVWSQWSTGRLFTVDGTPPEPFYPSQNLTSANQRPRFWWYSKNGATSYQLQVTSTGFDSPYVATINVATNHYSWTSSLAHNRTYQWRIRARDGIGQWSSWSAIRNVNINYNSNDNFDTAHVIATFLPYSSHQYAGAATTAVDDPIFTCVTGQRYHTVWYRYTPTSSGWVTIDTFGSNYDTVLAVWTGSRGSLSSMGCNDDAGGTLQSQLPVYMVAGTTYHIEIASWSTYANNLQLNFRSGYMTSDPISMDKSDDSLPSVTPTLTETAMPTIMPETVEPVETPTSIPTLEPTDDTPTDEPVVIPTEIVPTDEPTPVPTETSVPPTATPVPPTVTPAPTMTLESSTTPVPTPISVDTQAPPTDIPTEGVPTEETSGG